MKKWKKLYGASETFICPYCLKEFPLSKATRDHMLPKSRGGTNDPGNIVLCCAMCNAEKGSLTTEEYKEWKRLEFIRNGGKSR